MKFSARLLAVVCLLLWASTPAHASAESQRYLRNAIHFYDVGQDEKSKAYFIAILSIGTVKEQRLARLYLAEPRLRHVPRAKTSYSTTSDHPLTRPTDLLIEEPEEAPERHEKVTEERLEPPHFSGYLKNETAFRTSAPSQLTKFRELGYLAGTGELMEGLSYKVSGRAYYDAVYDLTNHYPPPVKDDMRQQGVLRETYLDLSKGDWDVRAGKQQIVWGEAVGLFYADVVNAKDLREFLLPDFDFIRIPEWAVDTEYTKNDFHAELIALPIPEMDQVGRPGSEFAFPVPTAPGAAVQYGPEEKPAQTLENGEAGGRLSYRTAGWDFGLFHLRTWEKFPLYTHAFSPGLETLTATHPRLTVDGFTFAKEIEEIVLKGEFIYSGNKHFQTTDPANPTGVISKGYVDYLLGADRTFGKTVSASVQFTQRLIQNYERDLYGQKQGESTAAFGLRDEWLDDKLEPEFLIIADLGFGGSMMRPKISYKFAENWRVAVGADLFSGNPEGLFGQFSNHDRATFELRYDFSYPTDHGHLHGM